jgi:hypothetical protein
MTIGFVLLGLALLFLVVLYLARPFLAPTKKKRKLSKRQSLLAQKEIYLDQIQSLDFDHDTGKLPDEVYRQQRQQVLADASAVYKQLDELGSLPTMGINDKQTVDVDAEIEAAIARFRQPSPARQSNGKASFCTQCGQPSDAGDRFCAHCGHKLHAKPLS